MPQPPRRSVALLGQQVQGALHVAGGEVHERLLAHLGIPLRHDDAVATVAHVREQPADVLAHQVGLQRPRRVRVADHVAEVRDPGQHHPLVGHGVGQAHLRPVHHHRDAPEGEQREAGRGHDHVRLELVARHQPDPGRGEGVDVVGDHVGPALADDLEQVAIRHQAQPLVPRVVRRPEVPVDVVPLGQPGDHRLADQLLHQLRVPPAQLVAGGGHQHVLPAGHRVRRLGRQTFAQRDGDPVDARQGEHVGRGALQHRHVRRGPVAARQRRHQRDRRGAAADHDDPLAGVG